MGYRLPNLDKWLFLSETRSHFVNYDMTEKLELIE